MAPCLLAKPFPGPRLAPDLPAWLPGSPQPAAGQVASILECPYRAPTLLGAWLLEQPLPVPEASCGPASWQALDCWPCAAASAILSSRVAFSGAESCQRKPVLGLPAQLLHRGQPFSSVDRHRTVAILDWDRGNSFALYTEGMVLSGNWGVLLGQPRLQFWVCMVADKATHCCCLRGWFYLVLRSVPPFSQCLAI